MRVYLPYRTNGEISGLVMNDNTWPDGYDITSATPAHPLAIMNKSAHSQDPLFAGFVAFDCACVDNAMCSCGAHATCNYYVNDGVLTAKPDITLKVNGSIVTPVLQSVDMAQPVTLPPGTTFTFSIESAVPDGTSITLKPLTSTRLSPSNITMTFTGGIASCSLKTPPQSAMGSVGQAVMNKYLRPFTLHVMGW